MAALRVNQEELDLAQVLLAAQAAAVLIFNLAAQAIHHLQAHHKEIKAVMLLTFLVHMVPEAEAVQVQLAQMVHQLLVEMEEMERPLQFQVHP